MSHEIASLPPTPRFVDFSAEVPGLETETLETANLWESDEGLTFSEILDVINPLQHLPIVSSIYRAVTGDTISLGARLLGGALFGGPLGILTAGINAAFEEISGGNIAEHAVALFEELTGPDDDNPQIAVEPQAVPHAAKPETVAAMAAASVPATAATTRQIAPNPPPAPAAPAAILPPVTARSGSPLSFSPPSGNPTAPAVVPAANQPPPRTTTPRVNLPAPVSGVAAEALRQEAMTLPAKSNAPSRNSIAQFDGKQIDSATRRISQAILEGQRDQAQLLLASLSNGSAKNKKTDHGKDDAAARPIDLATRLAARSSAGPGAAQQQAPRPVYPNLPPSGASAAWFQQAMERALDKYQTSQGLRRPVGGAAISAAR